MNIDRLAVPVGRKLRGWTLLAATLLVASLLLAGAARLPAGGSGRAGSASRAEGQAVQSQPQDAALEAKALRIEKSLLSRCLLPNGYFAMFTLPGMKDAEQLLREAKWPKWPAPSGLPEWFHPESHPEFGPEAYHVYENSNQAEGIFIAAMSYRYAATKDPDAARSARIAFRALCKPFDWAISVGDPGFFPKPYGGMQGWFATRKGYHETSLDQTFIPSYGLWQFAQRVATPEEQQRILHYFQLQGHWWINNHYVYMYSGKLRQTWDPAKPYRSHAFKLLMPMYAGGKGTHDQDLVQEVKARMKEALDAGTLPLQSQYMPEMKDYLFWAQGAAYFMSQSDFAYPDYWRNLIEGYWRAAKSSWLPSIGAAVAMGQFDALQWRLLPYPPGPSPDPQWGFQGPIPSPDFSCNHAWLALKAYELGLDKDGPKYARAILDKFDENNMSEIWDLDHKLPPQISWRSQHILTQGLAAWLEAYWKGRLLKVW
jgi:hypothetical protein